MNKKRIIVDTAGGINWQKNTVPFSNKLAYAHNVVIDNEVIKKRGGSLTLMSLSEVGIDYSSSGGSNYKGYVWISDIWIKRGEIYIGVSYKTDNRLYKEGLQHNVGIYKLIPDNTTAYGYRIEKVLDHVRDTAGAILIEKFAPTLVKFWHHIDTLKGTLYFTGHDFLLEDTEGNFTKLFTRSPQLPLNIKYTIPLRWNTNGDWQKITSEHLVGRVVRENDEVQLWGIRENTRSSGWGMDRIGVNTSNEIALFNNTYDLMIEQLSTQDYIPNYCITLSNSASESPPSREVGSLSSIKNAISFVSADPRVKTILTKPINTSTHELFEIEGVPISFSRRPSGYRFYSDGTYGGAVGSPDDMKNQVVYVDVSNNRTTIYFETNMEDAYERLRVGEYYELWIPCIDEYIVGGTIRVIKWDRMRVSGETGYLQYRWTLLSKEISNNYLVLTFEGIPQEYDTVGGTWQTDRWTLNKDGDIQILAHNNSLLPSDNDILNQMGLELFYTSIPSVHGHIALATQNADLNGEASGRNWSIWNIAEQDATLPTPYYIYFYAPIVLFPFTEYQLTDGADTVKVWEYNYTTDEWESAHLDATIDKVILGCNGYTATWSGEDELFVVPLEFRRYVLLNSSGYYYDSTFAVAVLNQRDSYSDIWREFASHKVEKVNFYRRGEDGDFYNVYDIDITFDWSYIPLDADLSGSVIPPLIFTDRGKKLKFYKPLQQEYLEGIPNFNDVILFDDRLVGWTNEQIWWTLQGEYSSFSPLRSIKIPSDEKVRQVLPVGLMEYLTGKGSNLIVLTDKSVWALSIDDEGADIALIFNNFKAVKGFVYNKITYIISEQGLYKIDKSGLEPLNWNIDSINWQKYIKDVNWRNSKIHVLEDQVVFSLSLPTVIWEEYSNYDKEPPHTTLLDSLTETSIDLIIDFKRNSVYTRTWRFPYDETYIQKGSNAIWQDNEDFYVGVNLISGNLNKGYILLHNNELPEYDRMYAEQTDGATLIGVPDRSTGIPFESFIETHYIPVGDLGDNLPQSSLWQLGIWSKIFTGDILAYVWSEGQQRPITPQRLSCSPDTYVSWQEWWTANGLYRDNYLEGIYDWILVKMPIQGVGKYVKVRLELENKEQIVYLILLEIV